MRHDSHPDPSNISDQAREIAGKLKYGAVPEVRGAVVPTWTVTFCAPLPLICTELLDSVQVGAGVTVGVMVHLKLTVPVNAPDGARSRLKLAVCPALIV